jgi:hypothetical protein
MAFLPSLQAVYVVMHTGQNNMSSRIGSSLIVSSTPARRVSAVIRTISVGVCNYQINNNHRIGWGPAPFEDNDREAASQMLVDFLNKRITPVMCSRDWS